MALFTPATNSSAFLKAGFMGLAGSGKTHTAASVAVGLIQYLRDRGIEYADKPVFFLDTETGSDYVKPMFDRAGVPLMQAKTRAFADLVPAVLEAERNGSMLLIDSITHFWTEFTESYARKRNRRRGLEFQDWSYLKMEWRRFTDIYVNSSLHIIMCGRMGYEYDFFQNEENGKKELEKTGVKMKAETETGYEPSILVLMERQMEFESKRQIRRAYILKERFNVIDGAEFVNPTFANFLPHIELLNLGGAHCGIDSSRTSDGIIPSAESSKDWKYREEQRAIFLEKVQALFTEHGVSGRSDAGKARVIELLKKHFHTTSWREVESFSLQQIKDGFDSLHLELNGAPYFTKESPPQFEDVPI